MLKLRALLFEVLFIIWTLLTHILCLPLLIGPRSLVLIAGRTWIDGTLWLLRVLTGIEHRVAGRRHLRKTPALFAAKHQSAWETLALARLLDFPAFILKRELLAIPLFGWYLRKTGMIGIDRKGGASALKRMVRLSREALATGRPLVIFPEGTRVRPNHRKAYQSGVAALYGQLGVPVVPVAVNSGLYWGKGPLDKKPGIITLAYLPPIPPGLDKRTFMSRLEAEIETASDRLVAHPCESSE